MTLQIRTVATQAADASKTKNAPLDVRRAIQAATDEKAGTRQDSAKVILSDSGKAQVKMLQFQQGMNSIGEARKSAARAHAAQIKQQIEALKKIAVTLGPMASKALLRQIKHLAQQVRQIAAELAQSSTVSNPGEAALNGDLSVDAHVDFFGAGTEDGEGASTADAEREAVAAQAEASAGEAEKEESDDEGEGEGKGAAVAQAEQTVQAAQSAEREIQAQEAREDDKKGAVGNARSGAARGDARQEDVLLVRDLARELRLLLSLAKGALLKKDKEDKDNIEEIEAALSDINDLAGELEAAAQSATDAEAAITAEASGTASVDTAVGDAAVSISVFA